MSDDEIDDAPVAIVEDPPAAEVARPRRLVGDPLPAVCDVNDVGELLGLGPTRMWELVKAHALDFALLQPPIGNKPRFSGKKLQAWIDGELVEPAADASRHYFGGARKRR